VTCERCGRFKITGTARRLLELNPLTPRQVANLSGWLRQAGYFVIDSSNFDQLRDLRTPTVGDRANRLLLTMAQSQPVPGKVVAVEFTDKRLFTMAWAEDEDELRYFVLDYLRDGGFLDEVEMAGGSFSATITPAGWRLVEELQAGNEQSQTGFIAMWFHPLLQPVQDALILAVQQARYEPVIMTRHAHNNRTDDEILALIRRSRFVIADCTGQRPNVYFEAGFAQGLHIPVIWTCREKEVERKRPHFDVRQYNFTTWDSNVEVFVADVRYRIERTIGQGQPLRLTPGSPPGT
jgi:hypothetical protein